LCSLSRFSRDWRKEHVLTWGGLIGCMADEKSAEAILGSGNELSINGGGLTDELKG